MSMGIVEDHKETEPFQISQLNTGSGVARILYEEGHEIKRE